MAQYKNDITAIWTTHWTNRLKVELNEIACKFGLIYTDTRSEVAAVQIVETNELFWTGL